MQIKTDREGAKIIKQLCHTALLHGGMDNLAGVTQVLANLDHPDKPKPEPKIVPEFSGPEPDAPKIEEPKKE